MGFPRLTRRRFLIGSAATIGLAGGGYWASRRPVRIGLIGAGLRGKSLSASLAQLYWLPGRHAEVAAICDVDRKHAEDVKKKDWPRADLYGDFRKVIERDDLRAVVIATPDHWHTLIAYHALKAGKAVYCEKPMSLTVAEGQFLVKTVQETNGVFQAGTQQRSDWRFRIAAELVRHGRLGNMNQITVTLPQRWKGESAGPFATFAPPPELDWEQWQGQAPETAYCPQRVHGTFRRFYEYSGGQMTDWGAHHVDIAQWALGENAPRTVEGQAQFPHVTNGFNTPLDFTADLNYPSGARIHVQTSPDENLNGITFEGEKSTLFVSRNRIEGPAIKELDDRPLSSDTMNLHHTPGRKRWVLSYHLMQFFDCIFDGAKPISDVESHHRSTSACHLTNIAMRLGRKLTWDSEQEHFVGDTEADTYLTRAQREPYRIPGMG